ncbi:hypothetical protein RND71_023539 [Anisodus tanguticus]|uniref:Uncharacterized protein n=1 Tax=Anisodus tanguticus TaxID=243964 RepID=A0AAE1RSS7_9SOLA|nr:hypothetical protein RND71_023539 [Anisodus tanguticus]
MAERITEYPVTIAVQLKTTVSSILPLKDPFWAPILTMDPNLNMVPPVIPAPVRLGFWMQWHHIHIGEIIRSTKDRVGFGWTYIQPTSRPTT